MIKPNPAARAPGRIQICAADANHLPLRDQSVDLVVTSPPYWRKRDYGFPQQIGRERNVDTYIRAIIRVLRECRRVLRDTGSVFLNVGDSHKRKSLAGVPALLEIAARTDGWMIPNRIIWTKPTGMPSPNRSRLVSLHEYVFHLAKGGDYYYDLEGYREHFSDADSGDVWNIALRPRKDDHLAPFPPELVERAVLLACPYAVCEKCGAPQRRILRRTHRLDPHRPQALRAMEIAGKVGLTDDHIAAIQATGICDAGKALRFQNGAGQNSERVRKLAVEAKSLLGGYFREFTFAKRVTVGFTQCGCGVQTRPGIVLDPFAGTGTTLDVAAALGRLTIGTDYAPFTSPDEKGRRGAGAPEQFTPSLCTPSAQ